MKIATIVAALVILFASLGGAQEMPPGKWWQNREMARELALTGEQRERLDTIFVVAAPQLIELRAETQKKALALRNQLDRPALDRDSILQAAEEVSRARAQLFERELMMLVEMRGVLNEEQWNRFRNHIENRPMRGQGMGPGPGMRPGENPRRPRPGGGGRGRP
ncbi:MAG TPA: periplasmic heavy metal sensor [Thermoanaerobaculia bacterium]|nr:periplasmic heavy metal sensor [Thermoanaerobaculia bacterium]